MTPSTSPDSNASANRATNSRSSRELGSGACSRPLPDHARGEGRSRPVQGARLRRLAQLEHFRDLTGAEAEHVVSASPPLTRTTVAVSAPCKRAEKTHAPLAFISCSIFASRWYVSRISSSLIRSRCSPSTVCVDNRYLVMIILLVIGGHFRSPPTTNGFRR
jgi:hypothetical protein